MEVPVPAPSFSDWVRWETCRRTGHTWLGGFGMVPDRPCCLCSSSSTECVTYLVAAVRQLRTVQTVQLWCGVNCSDKFQIFFVKVNSDPEVDFDCMCDKVFIWRWFVGGIDSVHLDVECLVVAEFLEPSMANSCWPSRAAAQFISASCGHTHGDFS